jgi:hypothetical protein
MANLMLKRTIMEVVDNQLKANDPPCTRDTYEKLLNAGDSAGLQRHMSIMKNGCRRIRKTQMESIV